MPLNLRVFISFLTGFFLVAGSFVSPASSALSTRKEVPEFLQLKSWLNSPGKPLTRESVRGKTVLFFFWNAGSAESLRLAETIQAWTDWYQPYGLQVVSFHTPEYEFEKSESHAAQALKRRKLQFPVGMDTGSSMWKAFNMLERPAVVLADQRGRIRHIFYGRREIPEIEKKLRLLLSEAGQFPQNNPEQSFDTTPPGSAFRLGYGGITGYGNFEKIVSERPQVFSPPAALAPEHFFLRGSWIFQREFLTPGKTPAEIIVNLRAERLHLTAGSRQSMPVTLRVSKQGQPIPKIERGADVTEENGWTCISVRAFRPYEILRLKEGARNTSLEIRAEGPVELYRIES